MLFLATYLGLISWAPVHEAIESLGSQEHVREQFRDPGVGRREALFILLMFLLLTPLAGLVGLFVMVFLIAVAAGLVATAVRKVGLPDWVATTLVIAVLAIVVYARREAWWPWFEWALAFVARAYLVLLE